MAREGVVGGSRCAEMSEKRTTGAARSAPGGLHHLEQIDLSGLGASGRATTLPAALIE
jgi:hypothetical protein